MDTSFKMTLLILQLSLLLLFFLSSEVVQGKPSPPKIGSSNITTVRPEVFHSAIPNVINHISQEPLNTSMATAVKCYHNCNASCNDDQCNEQCIFKCNNDTEGRGIPRKPGLTEVRCYHNCSSSCDNNQCYEPCIFKCSSDSESTRLPNDVPTPAQCYEACEAKRDIAQNYNQCIVRCASLQTDADFPPEIGSDVRQSPVNHQSPSLKSNLTATPPSEATVPPIIPPLITTLRSLSTIPVIPTHSPHSSSSSLPSNPTMISVPSISAHSSDSEAESPAAPGDLVQQREKDQNCTAIVTFTCDAHGENCVAEDTSYDCEENTSDNRGASYPEQPPCLGLCLKLSVDGRCLKDTSCCASLFREGRQFLRCLID